jgi:hypothetical protein
MLTFIKCEPLILPQGIVAIDTLEPIFDYTTTSRGAFYIKTLMTCSYITAIPMTLNERKSFPQHERDERAV